MADRVLECDLYQPVRDYLAQQGYLVYGEVKDCDLTAVKDGDLVVVELKLNFNMALLLQAVERQKAADSVYLAIPRPKGGLRASKWRNITHLLRKLELGLILVDLKTPEACVEVILHPAPFDSGRSGRTAKSRRRNIIREINGRSGDYNMGGGRGKVMTAYRENCIFIACCLERFGPLAPRQLRQLGTGEKTQSILAKNHYGWFDRIERGVYDLTEKGRAEFRQHPNLVQHYTELIGDTMFNDHQCQP